MAEDIIGRVHPETETDAERRAGEAVDRRIELLDILNSAISLCEPVKLDQFNTFIKATNDLDLEELGDNEDRLEIVGDSKVQATPVGVTTLGLIAVITDVLVGKRLGVEVNDDGEIIEFLFVDGK